MNKYHTTNESNHLDSVHNIVSDLKKHKAIVYWMDLLFCSGIFWSLQFLGTVSWLWFLPAVFFGSFTLYRMALFAHEVSHFQSSTLPGFETIWNILCGVPILMPSYTLKSHIDHHSVSSYGTPGDPEYLPFAAHPEIIKNFIFGASLVPFMFIFRFMVISPISILSVRIRLFLRERLTFLSMNGVYRPGTHQKMSGMDLFWEFLATLWAWSILILTSMGFLSWHFMVLFLTTSTLANLLNMYRTLVYAHKYASVGNPMSFREQLKDSIIIDMNNVYSELIGPVGQRYHATHHLLPYLPYHALPTAHQRLRLINWEGKADYMNTFSNRIAM